MPVAGGMTDKFVSGYAVGVFKREEDGGRGKLCWAFLLGCQHLRGM